MKSQSVLSIYLFALIGGILLILLHRRASLFEGIVIAAGILFLVPCCWMLIQIIVSMTKFRKPLSTPEGTTASELDRRSFSGLRGLMLVPVAGGICFGTLLVCMPGFFVTYLIYTFGIVMVLCGLAQLIFTVPGMRLLGISRWWLLPPGAVTIIGIAVFVLGPEEVQNTITLLTGIVLTVYGLEGFAGYIYRQSRLRATEIMNRG